MKTTIATAAALAAMVLGVGAASAAPTAEQICTSSQHGAVGKYAACVARAEERLALGGSAARYTASLSRCTARFETAWQGLEQAAEVLGTTCPTETQDEDFLAFLDACNQSVADALDGGTLISDPVTCNGDLMTCQQDLSACLSPGASPDAVDVCNVGTATQPDVLSGKTFSSTAGVGLIGTMPNNGAVTLVPTTSNQAIAAGYHNGSGKCQGDVDLVAANIRNGVNLFGVVGTSIKATGTALPQYVVEGLTYSNSSGPQVGTMVNRKAYRVYPGVKDAKIPAGFHNGYGACAGDQDLLATNIRDGVVMFGVTGSIIEASGNATASQVLFGNTFSNSAGADTGTMPDIGQQNVTPGTSPVTILEGYHDGTGAVAGDTDLVAGNIKAGVTLFGVSGSLVAGGGKLPKTGQTTAYGTGSDGNVQAGATRSFTDNGDGTITDNATGLMWEKKDDSGGIHDYGNSYTWSTGTDNLNGTAATTFLATLNAGGGFAGHTDWRMPNLTELESLRNLQAVAPAVYHVFNSGCTPACTVTTCSCTPSALYWSSSSYLDLPSFAWVMNFTDGDTQSNSKTDAMAVRAVRGGL